MTCAGTGKKCIPALGAKVLATKLVGGEFTTRIKAQYDLIALNTVKLKDAEQVSLFSMTVEARIENHEELCTKLGGWLNENPISREPLLHSRSTVQTAREIAALNALKTEIHSRLFGKPSLEDNVKGDWMLFTTRAATADELSMSLSPSAMEKFSKTKYWNMVTNETSWVAPAGFDAGDEAAAKPGDGGDDADGADGANGDDDDDDDDYVEDAGDGGVIEEEMAEVEMMALSEPDMLRILGGNPDTIELGDFVEVELIGPVAYLKKELGSSAFKKQRTDVGIVVAAPPDAIANADETAIAGREDTAKVIYGVKFITGEWDDHVQRSRITKLAPTVCSTYPDLAAMYVRARDGAMLSSLAWAELHTFSKKSSERKEVKKRTDFKLERVPAIRLGQWLAKARYKTEHSEWQFKNPQRLINANTALKDLFTAWCKPWDARLKQLSTQLEAVKASETVFGKTVKHSWGGSGNWRAAKLKYKSESIPLVTAPLNGGALGGLSQYQGISHVNGVLVNYGNIKSDKELGMQFPKIGDADVLFTVHVHTSQTFTLEIPEPISTKKKAKNVDLTGLQVFADGDGYVRVSDVAPGTPAAAWNLEQGDIIASCASKVPDRMAIGDKKAAKALVAAVGGAKPGELPITTHANRFEIEIPDSRPVQKKKRRM